MLHLRCLYIHVHDMNLLASNDLSGGMEEECLPGIETWSLHFCTIQCDDSNVIHSFFGEESRYEKTTNVSFEDQGHFGGMYDTERQ